VLFDTNIGVAVRCTNCGKLAIRNISLFNLPKDGFNEERCGCGRVLFKIKSGDSKSFRVHINCIACGKEHLYTFSSKLILSGKLKILNCPSSRLDISFVGNRELVRNVAIKHQKDLQELIKVLEV